MKKTEKQALKGLDKKEQKALFKMRRIEANLLDEEVDLAEEIPTLKAHRTGGIPAIHRGSCEHRAVGKRRAL